MTEGRVGQAVFTDPGGSSAGGYLLLAASPTVDEREADFFASSPGISDHLHRGQNPGPYLSFFQLPSGRWALVRRFVAGDRKVRGYHRIVSHLLIFSESLLEDLEFDASLLALRCRFATPQGSSLSLAELGRTAAAPELRELADLQPILPPDPPAEAIGLIEERRAFLREAWGGPRLEGILAWIFDALGSGYRVLLPQGLEMEQALGLVVSCLPAVDRRDTPWTTHFAAGVQVLFRLANAPDPEEARHLHRRLDEWHILPRDPAPPAPDTADAGSVLARLVGGGSADLLREMLQGLRSRQLSLLESPSELARWVNYIERDARALARGFDGFHGLEEYLRRERPGRPRRGGEDWIDNAAILRGACATGLAYLDDGMPFHQVRGSLADTLGKTGWSNQLLQPRVLEAGLRHHFQTADPRIHQLATALLAGSLARPPEDADRRQALAQLLAKPPLAQYLMAGDPICRQIWTGLALDLTRSGRPAGRAMLTEQADTIPGALEDVLERLQANATDLEAILAFLESAWRHKRLRLGARAVAERLVPLFAAEPRLAEQAVAADLDRAFGLLRRRPDGLVQALRSWPASLLDRAVAELKAWLREAPQVGLTCAAELSREALPRSLHQTRELIGTTLLLRHAGAVATAWLPFAVLEADIIRTVSPQQLPDDFQRALEGAELSPREAAPACRQVLRALEQSSQEDGPGEALHRLFELVLPGLPAVAPFAEPVLARLLDSDQPILRWEGTFRRAIEALRGRPEADQLRRLWWHRLALAQWRSFPSKALTTLEGLRGPDLREVLELWLPRLTDLGQQPGERRLLAALAARAEEDPTTAFRFRSRLLTAEVRHARATLEDALIEIDSDARRTGVTPDIRRAELLALLPEEPTERLASILRLAASPVLLPSLKRFLETGPLVAALRRQGVALRSALPAFDQLARRGPTFLPVLAQAGRRWRDSPELAEDLLRRCLVARRFDGAAALLLAAADGNAANPGFLRHLEHQRPRAAELLGRYSAQAALHRRLGRLAAHLPRGGSPSLGKTAETHSRRSR